MRFPTLLSFLLGATLWGQGAPPNDPVAEVLQIDGRWTINGKRSPPAPIDLYDKDTLLLSRDETKGSVKIMYMDGTLFKCALPSCARVDIVRAIQPQASIFSRIFAALSQAVMPAREGYVPARVRGGFVPDGIGILTGSSLEITPAGDPSKLGDQILQFRRYRSDRRLDPPVLGQFKWTPKRPVEAPGITPGLYSVNILHSDPPSEFFLLLVVDGANSKEISEEFAAFLSATKAWPVEDQGDAAAALRLYLWGKAKLLTKQ